jgi:hypothetical protein
MASSGKHTTKALESLGAHAVLKATAEIRRATFSDGETITRRSANRYSHAYRIKFRRPDGEARFVIGFASSRVLASKGTDRAVRLNSDWAPLGSELVEVLP